MDDKPMFTRKRYDDDSVLVKRAATEDGCVSVCAVRSGSVMLTFTDGDYSIGKHMTPAEARAIAAELVAACEAIE